MSNRADQGRIQPGTGHAVVAATHNPEPAGRMAGRFELKSGDLYEQSR
jgi:hypothetical protein